ncbi:hypothetical protein AB4254_12000 [Vibrio breoganii]
MKTLIGRFAVFKNSAQHPHSGHHGFILSENSEDNEYQIAGGSLSTFNEDGSVKGAIALACREDFSIPRLEPQNPHQQAAREEFEAWLSANNR